MRYIVTNNPGRFQIKRFRKKRHAACALDDSATALTNIPLIEDRRFEGLLKKQVLQLTMGLPLQKAPIYIPTIDISELVPAKKKWTDAGLRCQGCGRPRSNGSGTKCRACYAKGAVKTWERKHDARRARWNDVGPMVDFWIDMASSTAMNNLERIIFVKDDPLAFWMRWEKELINRGFTPPFFGLHSTIVYEAPPELLELTAPRKMSQIEYFQLKGLARRSLKSTRKRKPAKYGVQKHAMPRPYIQNEQATIG